VDVAYAIQEEILLAKSRTAKTSFAKAYYNVQVKHLRLLAKLPQRYRAPASAGAVAALLSSTGHACRVFKGEEGVLQATVAVGKDVALASGATLVAEGVMTRIGSKWVLIVSCQKIKTGVGAGVAVFVFDEARTVWNFLEGELTTDEFIYETGKNSSVALASGAATYCSILLGASATGFTVVAVAIGTELLVHAAWAKMEEIHSRNFIFVEDLIGRLPLSVLNRRSYWRADGWNRRPPGHISERTFDVDKPYRTGLGYEATRGTQSGKIWE